MRVAGNLEHRRYGDTHGKALQILGAMMRNPGKVLVYDFESKGEASTCWHYMDDAVKALQLKGINFKWTDGDLKLNAHSSYHGILTNPDTDQIFNIVEEL